MSFATWLKRKRQEEGLDLRSLEFLTKVNAATINRVENGIVSPTIESTALILGGLNLSPVEYYQALAGEDKGDPPLYEEEGLLVAPVPTLLDVYRFDKFVSSNSEAAQTFLSSWLSEISGQKNKEPNFFRPQDIEILLFKHGLCLFMLQYPYKVSVETIKNNYSRGGAVIWEDVYIYVGHKIYRMTARKAASVFATHHKMSNPSSMRKVKLDDLVKLDSSLGGNGEIIVMTVKAAYFDILFNPNSMKPGQLPAL